MGREWQWEVMADGSVHPLRAELRIGESEECSDWLDRLGFRRWHTDGHQDIEQIEWYRANEGPGMMACWTEADEDTFYFIPDESARLRFRALAAPILMLKRIEQAVESLENCAEKAFRASHGHAPDDICDACAPEEMKGRREREEGRRQRRNEGSNRGSTNDPPL